MRGLQSPQFQSPQVLSDLYRDLRDRKLLPLVLVLIVGMAVVPIALSSSAEAPPPAAPVAAAPPPSGSAAPAKEVVLAEPGVRDYTRRLDGKTPTDPFVQRFASPPPDVQQALEAATGAAPGGDAGAAAAPASPAPSPDAGGAVAPTGGGTTTVRTETDTKVIFYRLKVKSGQVGGEMKVKDEVGPSAQLPSKAVPAVVFLGADFTGDLKPKRAYFMVSNGVSAISGQGQCSLGDPCQLISLKPGQHMDFVWIDGLPYRVTLLDFKRHVRDQVPGAFGGEGSAGRGKRRGSR